MSAFARASGYHPPCGRALGSCNASELKDLARYADAMASSIVAAQGKSGRDGHFLTSCSQHEQTCRARDFFGITIGGSTLNETLWRWYTGGGGATGASARDVAWPGDSSCAAIAHGIC